VPVRFKPLLERGFLLFVQPSRASQEHAVNTPGVGKYACGGRQITIPARGKKRDCGLVPCLINFRNILCIRRPIYVSERCPGRTFQDFFLLLTEIGKGSAKREVSVRLIALHRSSLRHPEFRKTVSVRLTVFHFRPRNDAPLWKGYQTRRCALSKT
jgi:hypothetical protein